MEDKTSAIRNALLKQGEACLMLGSPFTHYLCRLFSENLDGDTPLGQVVFGWEGDYTSKGDNVSLRLCGLVNYLVLCEKAPALAAIYPPHNGWESEGEHRFWELILAAIEANFDITLQFLKYPPQTNEVKRSAALIPAYHVISKKFQLPIHIYELGASAGLNLNAGDYGLVAGSAHYNPTSLIQLEPEWRGEDIDFVSIKIDQRSGCDLLPVDFQQNDNRLRLLSYVWPDQLDRVRLIKAAIAYSLSDRAIHVVKEDAIEFLQQALASRTRNQLKIIQHTIAWQYFPDELKQRGEALFETYGAKASNTAPLARIAMENDGRNDSAALSITLWPKGETYSLGRADFHGRWIEWKNPDFSN